MGEPLLIDTYKPGKRVLVLEPTGKVSKDTVKILGSRNITLESGRQFGTEIWHRGYLVEKRRAKPGKLFPSRDELLNYEQRVKLALQAKAIIKSNWADFSDFTVVELNILLSVLSAAEKNKEKQHQRIF